VFVLELYVTVPATAGAFNTLGNNSTVDVLMVDGFIASLNVTDTMLRFSNIGPVEPRRTNEITVGRVRITDAGRRAIEG